MFARLTSWLYRVPITDPVDLNNAVFMQIFLLFIGCVQLLNKIFILARATNISLLYQSHSRLFPWARLPMVMDLGTDITIAVSAWLGVYLIRKGHFRGALIQYLSVLLISAAAFFAAVGIPDSRNDSSLFIALVISGLMLGRSALWYVFAAIMSVYLIGLSVEVIAPPDIPMAMHGAFSEFPGTVYSFITAAIAIDFGGQALRKSLTKSQADHRKLQAEIVERERAQNQLLHSQKVEMVGRLASGIAHDIHNVLGIVLGFAGVRHKIDEPGMDFGKDATVLVDALEGTELAARRGASICRKLLNFSRRDSTRNEAFDVVSALTELRPMLGQLLPPSIQLTTRYPDTKLFVNFDQNQLELALLNLVSNARDAMPSGGSCTISVAQDGTGRTVISVSDTGVGISDEHKQRVFEPFFTTKPSNQGTGLGLSVVYDLLNKAGGDIQVQSRRGGGTTFFLYFPRVEHVFSENICIQTNNGPRVLLIEDDKALSALLATALIKSGCPTLEAATGVEAERIIAQEQSLPEVLVCDHHLPDTDGMILLRKLRERIPTVPVILISAHLENHHINEDNLDPLGEHLPKPFLPEQLVARVRAAAIRHRPV